MAAKSREPDPAAPDTLAEGGGILCLGLFRTGTYSMTKALQILGFPRILHGIDSQDPRPWARSTWAEFPYVRTVLYPDPAHPPIWLQPGDMSKTGFDKADWDELFGEYHGATDIASLYALQLAEAYPNAKVVLVERNVDSWANSLEQTELSSVTGPVGTFVRTYAEPWAGIYSFNQLWDVLRGWARVRNVEEMRAVYKDRYREHYDILRERVAKERLLEYKLGEGWEPLCEFLGKEVPDVEFPRVIEGKDLRLLLKIGMAWTSGVALWKIARYPLLVSVIWLVTTRTMNQGLF